MRVRVAAVTAALALLAPATGALAGCGPSEPFAPVAVAGQDGSVEIRYTACKRAGIRSAKLIRLEPGQKVIDGREPVLWRVSFAQPAALTSLQVGTDAPTGGVVEVPLTQPLDGGVRYEAFLELDDGTEPHTGFDPAKLGAGQVRFEDEYLTREQFERRSACD